MATTDRLPTTEEMVAGTYLTPDNTPQVVAGNPTLLRIPLDRN